jgi:hypothetical protein
METANDLLCRQKAMQDIHDHPGIVERSPSRIAMYPQTIKAKTYYLNCGLCQADVAFLREADSDIAEIDMINLYDSEGSELSASGEMRSMIEHIRIDLPDFIRAIREHLGFGSDSYKELWVDAFLVRYSTSTDNEGGTALYCKRLPGYERKRIVKING